MNARRTMIAALALSLAGLGTLGAAGAVNATHQPAVAISTATSTQRSSTSVGIEGCSSDCGLQDEPTSTRTAAVIIPPVTSVPTTTVAVACTDAAPWPSDSVSVELAQRCDYRVTGGRCEEDEYCGIQEIRDTHDFTGTP